ncbi:leucyl/phenylalanyl-tRNA--protein transferase [Rhodocaloribacter litoris]|uniref:leucyl/phenylalanyl-tRNA--protein transferase n=1 Tax=Rhodocaloribacter litoris TaxID=2558931 RepID=UPI001420A57A|nr:leucyl/phenylalanyl-tRNA--protein transferase [Rhodocaloribacter litoris]QXD16688.1 leucyl/phenylalanyl-tRNA--protein transferase [Rhodocaloribacter litoris]
MDQRLTPELLLYGYRHGIFPMADPRDGDAVYWFDPDPRAVIPLDAFHVPKSLARLVRKGTFEVVTDRDFEGVMRACADRAETWISEEIIQAYVALHRLGHAHSVECRRHGRLAGGLYGVALGGAFFGESMFHRERDASKVALVHLVERLRRGGFVLLDTQYLTPHLARFGAIEIPRAEYRRRLAAALRIDARWQV